MSTVPCTVPGKARGGYVMVVTKGWNHGGVDVWSLSLQPKALSPPSASQVVHPPCFQGFSILSSEGPILSLEPHFENWSLLLFLRVTAHLHFDQLFASLRFVSHRQSDSHTFGRSLMGCTKYWQRNPQQHTNCKSFSQNFKLLCFCKTIFWKSSFPRPPPPFVQNSVFTKCLPYVLGTIPGAGNIVINRAA